MSDKPGIREPHPIVALVDKHRSWHLPIHLAVNMVLRRLRDGYWGIDYDSPDLRTLLENAYCLTTIQSEAETIVSRRKNPLIELFAKAILELAGEMQVDK